MPHRLRKSQLIEFEDVAAGHEGMRSDKSGAIVVKPCRQAEIDFYETTAAHQDFRPFIPEFVGTVLLNQEASEAPIPRAPGPSHGHARSSSLLLEPSSAAAVADTWIPSGGGSIAAEKGIALENVTYGFTKPNILDVKLGSRLWADDAPPAKRQKLDKVAEETTSGSLNFRIAGMKTWMGPTPSLRYRDSNGYRKCDKTYGRAMTSDTVIRGFEEYFLPEDAGLEVPLVRRVVEYFIHDLKDLVEVLSKQESRMYSASLLFVYEGDGAQLAEKFQIEEVIRRGGNLDELDESSEQAASQPPSKESAPAGNDATDAADTAGSPPATGGPGTPPAIQVVEARTSTDTANSSIDSEPRMPRIQALKMIDFAHASWVPGQGPDENLLTGIRNTIRVMSELLEKI